MRAIAVALMCAAVTLVASAQQAKPSSPEALLGAALHQEEVEGSLDAAIATYKKIVADPRASRATVATALLHLGGCYEKLGNAEARKAYERLTREFADQAQIAAEARARLSRVDGGADTTAMTLKKVWSGPKVDPDGGISSDGRYLSFMDLETGDLAIHDFTTGSNRRLTNNKATFAQTNEFAEESAISRDGRQVAYSWFNGQDRWVLRLLGFKGLSQPRQLFDNADGVWMAPYDWSPDGKWIAVQVQRKDRSTQIGLIGVPDGSLHVLKSIGWRGSSKLFFSPDGKYLAFDLPKEDTGQPDVFVVAVDGSREAQVVENPAKDQIMGWTPDGRRLLFASDRNGATGLWSVAIADGKAQRAPELIKGQVEGYPLGVSAAGTLYFALRAGDRDIRIGSIDFSTGRQLTAPLAPAESYVGANQQPEWSPDGKYLAYVSGRDAVMGSVRVLMIRSMETDRLREVHVKLGYFNWPRWAPDGRSLVVYGRDLKGRQGLYRVDVETGDATTLVHDEGDEGSFGPDWSPDGRRLYFRRFTPGGGYAAIERDLATGAERSILRRSRLGPPAVSPDGRYLAATTGDSQKSLSVLLIPIDGGEPREVFRIADEPRGQIGTWATWTPDGRSIVVNRAVDEAGKTREVWLIPIAGGTPRKLDIRLTENVPVRVHPDGRRIAFVAGEASWEVWTLERFLSRPPAK